MNLIFKRFFYLSGSPAKRYVLKSSRPSLPLKKAPPLTPTLSPQERGRKPPYSVLEPLRYKVGGPKRSRQVMRDGTAWGGMAICECLTASALKGSHTIDSVHSSPLIYRRIFYLDKAEIMPNNGNLLG